MVRSCGARQKAARRPTKLITLPPQCGGGPDRCWLLFGRRDVAAAAIQGKIPTSPCVAGCGSTGDRRARTTCRTLRLPISERSHKSERDPRVRKKSRISLVLSRSRPVFTYANDRRQIDACHTFSAYP